MKLSIGMIVKNEEKYLDRCLIALRPILENVDSELIIVDTGSTDRTVEIAKTHTKKVYFYKWNDDFAAARNETIKYATGEWYMFVDADEILVDATEIIQFFNLGIYKQFGCGKYYINNCSESDENKSSKTTLFRMHKITSDTKFIGIVHEIIMPNGLGAALYNTEFKHYGYTYTTKEEAIKKAYRNIELMIKRLENDIDCAMHRKQLADSYNIANNISEAINHIMIGIELAKNENNRFMSIVLYADLMLNYSRLNRYTDVLSAASEYFNLKNNENVTDVDIHYCLIFAYCNTYEHKKCIESYNKYCKLSKRISDGALHTPDESLRVIFSLTNQRILESTALVVDVLIRLKRYDEANQLLDEKIDLISENLSFARKIINKYLTIMDEKHDFSSLEMLYLKFIETDEKLQDIFESCIENYMKNDYKDNREFLDACYNLNIPTNYSEFLKIRYEHNNNQNNLADKIIEFISDIDTIGDKYIDLIGYMFEYNIHISHIYDKIDVERLKNVLNTLISKNKSKFIDCLISYDYNPKNLKDNFYYKAIYEVVLRWIDGYTYDICIQLIEKYNNSFDKYSKFEYTKSALSDEYIYLMPKDVKFGYYFTKAFECKEKNDTVNYIKYLNHALKSDKNYKALISKLLDEIKKAEQPIDEYTQLTMSIKKNIFQFIENKDFATAKQLLDQYKSTNPSDPEIQKLENKIIQ